MNHVFVEFCQTHTVLTFHRIKMFMCECCIRIASICLRFIKILSHLLQPDASMTSAVFGSADVNSTSTHLSAMIQVRVPP